MITLFAYPSRFGVPSSSPFVMKTEIQLKMMNLPYHIELEGVDRAPKGKLPFIKDDGKMIADSIFIRLHLERKHGLDLDAGFDEIERALAWAAERLAEDSLFWLMVHARWAVEENFSKGPARNFDHLPETARDEVRNKQREKVIGYLDGQGTGRLSTDEMNFIARRGYNALSRLLGDKPYILGDNPCGADASIFAQVMSALVPAFPSPAKSAVSAHRNLSAYVDRMMARYYPDFNYKITN